MAASVFWVRPVALHPTRFFGDLYHWAMAVYYIVCLALNRSDTAPTYKYCWHLDQVTFFREQFRKYLHGDPQRLIEWKKRRVFVDYVPDPEEFASYADGTLGKAYYDMNNQHDVEGLLDLRSRRFEVLPAERDGLDLEALASASGEDLFERIISRRNIFMTSTHDFCHLLIGSDTWMAGEALAGRYQYRHLLVPQNWLNMMLSMLVHVISLRWSTLRKIMSCYPAIDASANYSEIWLEDYWDRQIAEVRGELGLPSEGFMPEGRFAD